MPHGWMGRTKPPRTPCKNFWPKHRDVPPRNMVPLGQKHLSTDTRFVGRDMQVVRPVEQSWIRAADPTDCKADLTRLNMWKIVEIPLKPIKHSDMLLHVTCHLFSEPGRVTSGRASSGSTSCWSSQKSKGKKAGTSAIAFEPAKDRPMDWHIPPQYVGIHMPVSWSVWDIMHLNIVLEESAR